MNRSIVIGMLSLIALPVAAQTGTATHTTVVSRLGHDHFPRHWTGPTSGSRCSGPQAMNQPSGHPAGASQPRAGGPTRLDQALGPRWVEVQRREGASMGTREARELHVRVNRLRNLENALSRIDAERRRVQASLRSASSKGILGPALERRLESRSRKLDEQRAMLLVEVATVLEPR